MFTCTLMHGQRKGGEREKEREKDMIGKQYFVCVHMILESEMN